MNDVKITSIRIDLNGKELEISLEEAELLRDALNKMLGDKSLKEKEIVYYPYHPSYPNPNEPYRITGVYGDSLGTYTVNAIMK